MAHTSRMMHSGIHRVPSDFVLRMDRVAFWVKGCVIDFVSSYFIPRHGFVSSGCVVDRAENLLTFNFKLRFERVGCFTVVCIVQLHTTIISTTATYGKYKKIAGVPAIVVVSNAQCK